MQPQSAQDYKQLLTDVIKKQIVILGPDITLSKARNVKGITVNDDGTVVNVVGSPQEVTQALIDQFVQLSGLIVKKTMEPLLSQTTFPPQVAVAATTPASPIVTQPQTVTDTTAPTPAAAPTVTSAQPPLVTPPEPAAIVASTQAPSQPLTSASPTQSAAIPSTPAQEQSTTPGTEINIQPVPQSPMAKTADATQQAEPAQVEPAKNPLAA